MTAGDHRDCKQSYGSYHLSRILPNKNDPAKVRLVRIQADYLLSARCGTRQVWLGHDFWCP